MSRSTGGHYFITFVSMTLVVLLTVRRAALAEFRDFEHRAAGLMRDHGGAIERAVVIDPDPEAPTLRELHIVTFPSPAAFESYKADPRQEDLAPLRTKAILATEIMTGEDGPAYGRLA